MTHLTTESDSPSNSLTGEAYLNSRREYWRKEAEKDRKNSEPKSTVVKAKVPSDTSFSNGLKGEAFLNSRRAYWRKEMEKNPVAHGHHYLSNDKAEKKSDNDLSIGQIISIIVGGILFGALIAWAGSLILLFALFVGAMLLKCMR